MNRINHITRGSVWAGGGASLGGIAAWGLMLDESATAWAIGGGVGLGTISYALYMLMEYFIKLKHAHDFYQTAQAAKVLGAKLRERIQQQAKGRIMVHAQDILEQMNGGSAREEMRTFFEKHITAIASVVDVKIERHIRYLTQRASDGSVEARRRLQSLSTQQEEFTKLLDRIFHPNTIAKIKDEVDTAYDRFEYDYGASRIR